MRFTFPYLAVRTTARGDGLKQHDFQNLRFDYTEMGPTVD